MTLTINQNFACIQTEKALNTVYAKGTHGLSFKAESRHILPLVFGSQGTEDNRPFASFSIRVLVDHVNDLRGIFPRLSLTYSLFGRNQDAEQGKISVSGISISNTSRRPPRHISRGFFMGRTFGGTSVHRFLDAVMLTPFVWLTKILACLRARNFNISRRLVMNDTTHPIADLGALYIHKYQADLGIF